MPKRQTASIKVKSISPSTDGKARIGDTVVFEVVGDGVISLIGYDSNDTVLWGAGLILGDFDVTIGWSQAWQSNPVPLTVHAELKAARSHKIVTIAETTFEALPEKTI